MHRYLTTLKLFGGVAAILTLALSADPAAARTFTVIDPLDPNRRSPVGGQVLIWVTGPEGLPMLPSSQPWYQR